MLFRSLKQFGNAKLPTEQMSIIETIGKIGDASVIATLVALCTSACMASDTYLVQTIVPVIAELCENDWKNIEKTPQDDREYWLARSLYSTDHKARCYALEKLGRWDDPYIVYHVLQLGRRDRRGVIATAVFSTLRNITVFREKYYLEPTAEHSKGEKP